MNVSVTKSTAILVAIGAVVGLILGVIIGHFSAGGENGQDPLSAFATDQWTADIDAGRSPQDIIEMVIPANIDANIKKLTEQPHLAGTESDETLATLIMRRFHDANFDTVKMHQMEFLLSRPNASNPNLIHIHDSNNDTVFTSHFKEIPLRPEDDNPNFIHAFNAYTPAGDVWSAPSEGPVFVNYGRIEDFEQLDKLAPGVVKGRIAIMKYGKIYRGNKVDNAARYGAIGAILFSDPDDVAREGQTAEDVYPNTSQLPGTGMQRGNTFIGNGDPLTPGWPSMPNAHRINKKDAGLPTIPCQPIGYQDAKEILSALGGARAPEDWQGGIIDLVYNLGPEMKTQYSGHRIQLTTHNRELMVPSYNVIGTVRGAVEPDRYVLIGNHRDAWGYGASDPSSGTAQLLETARVIGDLMKTGWRPRRTLVFCSWGSEEYGLIGSTEWVEEHVTNLQARAVTYINTDTCASGPHVQLKSSPLLWSLLTYVADMVPGILNGSTGSLLQEWIASDKAADPTASDYPILKTLGSGSDYAAFLFYAGVPSMDAWFRKDQSEHKGTYASYHTGYETYYMISRIVDPGSKIMAACSQVALLTLKYMADSLVLPLKLTHFPVAMKSGLESMAENGNREKLVKIYPKYNFLESSVDELIKATENFHASIDGKKNNPVAVRAVNDQLMSFEQTFLLPGGLPGRPGTRHAVFAPSQFDSYASAGFPGLSDLLYGYATLPQEEKRQRDEQIRRHINDLTIMTQRAVKILDNFGEF